MLTNLNSSPVPPTRLVILGAHGFIASHLARWSKDNHIECRLIGQDEVDLADFSSAQLLSSLLREDDVIVMTSMLTPEFGLDYESVMRNLRMVETVCTALKYIKCGHFIYLSSDAVYDAEKIPLDEDSSREPISLYALSHSAREILLGDFFQKNIPGAPLTILRLTAIYGFGDTHNAYGPNQFVRSALTDGNIKIYGRGEEKRSFVFIDDLIRLVGLVVKNKSVGVLNVAISPPTTFFTLANIVRMKLNTSVRIEFLPRLVPVVHRPYKFTQIFRFIYNLGRPIGSIVHRTFVNKAIFNSFPEFRFTSLEEGISELVNAEQKALADKEKLNQDARK
ncbi:NAD(P)-dependent oxidoreductase [Polynucleobacter sp. IMCC 30228]|uniref:NAD-dependent epimerase/dehydratase family protein n=1 Tax=Polynucleobacter sp. IMCC 30228 TaxID=2781011 RepID=UPI001F36BC72|nr:SDR family oxidoreductase [Polynucleobacter sp. IMCC 30228]MCE7527841.1 SDR family oxidoreductase [Polynucleobacter sp. IMCC 30228]